MFSKISEKTDTDKAVVIEDDDDKVKEEKKIPDEKDKVSKLRLVYFKRFE